MEELGIRNIKIWKLIHVHNFLEKETDQTIVDIRYEIPYSPEFDHVYLDAASHWFEIIECWFYDIADISWQYKPNSLGDIIYTQ